MGGFLSHMKPESNTEILDASCGPIRGNIYRHKEKIVNGYLGIPYGEVTERFEKPTEVKVWTQVKKCTKYGPGCPQSGVFEQMKEQLNLTFDENTCLTLNVFAPRWKSMQLPSGLPVMVNIFGGGFEMGTSAAYDDYSISGILPLKDVIVVTVNYRVGALGFFTTGDEVCKGNLALWDQTLALKWVRNHIHSFGGDPNNVTVFGCSAGGVCADLLTLSPHSRDLFQKCISMSGSAGCEMACRSRENQAFIFKEFAQSNGCFETDSWSLFKWYQQQSMEVLNKLSTFKFSPSGFMSCAPNLDGDYFPKTLEELRKDAPKKSFIYGRTEFEGLIMGIFEKLEGIDESDAPSARKRFIEFLGDAVFNVGISNSVQEASECGNNVFLYSFDYCNPNGYGSLDELLDFKASSHGNDFRYIFGSGGYENFNPTEDEFHVIETMADIFTNFATYGNPNGVDKSEIWKEYSMKYPGAYFKIDYPTSEMRNGFLNERLEKLKLIRRKKIML